MKTLSDIELLDAYARERSEDAFRTLVARHVDFVYSAAMRQLRNPGLAQEVTQSAFIALAGKAGNLPRQTVVVGWLHRAAHFAALNLLRSEARRKHWETEAAAMNNPGDSHSEFEEVALPQVDGALAELADSDRAAVILRFLQQRSFQDVAEALGTTEDAAKKRVNRALEKLRKLLGRRGVALSAAALAAGLSQLSVTAAPVGLSTTLATLASSGAAPTLATSASLIDLLRLPKTKLAGAVGLALLGLLAVLLWRPNPNNAMIAAANTNAAAIPRITLTSVMVDDQNKALTFYTNVLGFIVKYDVPTGEPGGARWLTVVSPDEPEGMELLLEPLGLAPAKVYQKALFDSAKPLVALATTDVPGQFERLRKRGVKFAKEPTAVDGTTIAVFEDTCGNHIQLFQTAATNSASNTASLRIKLNRILVNDQDRALKFYTDVLGLVKKRDLARGTGRWVTVTAPEAANGAELLLEAVAFAPARTFQEAVRKAGIPQTQLAVADVQKAYERMTNAGVVFSSPPMKWGPVTLAVFDDTCGNLIQLLEQ